MRKLSPQTRKTILEAAVTLMEDRDFTQVPTRELAARAGIAEATLFRYFPRKEEILVSLVEQEGRSFFESLDPILAVISSPWERLLAMNRHHAVFAFQRRSLVWALERELTYDRPTGAHLKVLLREFLADIEAQLRAGVEAGEFRQDLCLTSASLCFHGIVRLLLLQEQVFEAPFASQESFLQRADQLAKILLKGIQEIP